MPIQANLLSVDFESEYLCKSCAQPLYTQVATEQDACLNFDCPSWPDAYSPVETPLDSVHQDLNDQKSRLLAMIEGCNLAALRRFAYEQRRQLSLSWIETGAMQIIPWITISELLQLTQTWPSLRIHAVGLEDEAAFKTVVAETLSWGQRMRLVEDLKNGRYKILKRHDGTIDTDYYFFMKFLAAVRKHEKALGLIANYEVSDEATFEYEGIDSAATPAPPSDTKDISDRLEELWPLTSGLRLALRGHRRTARLYDYQPALLDLAIIAGYWLQSDDKSTSMIRSKYEGDETEKLDIYLRQFSDRSVTSGDFIRRYVDCTEQSPIILRTPDGWLLDETTLLLFLLYLQGDPSLAGQSTPRLDEPVLTRLKGSAGQEFEKYLRLQLANRGYHGPTKPVKESYEYDILMVSHARESVLLVEAKYRDINPSSVTGTNLVSQEVLGKDAILDQAERQELRLGHFLGNKRSFEAHLGPLGKWEGYEVESFLVTKSPPVISRFANTRILRANEFFASLDQRE